MRRFCMPGLRCTLLKLSSCLFGLVKLKLNYPKTPNAWHADDVTASWEALTLLSIHFSFLPIRTLSANIDWELVGLYFGSVDILLVQRSRYPHRLSQQDVSAECYCRYEFGFAKYYSIRTWLCSRDPLLYYPNPSLSPSYSRMIDV